MPVLGVILAVGVVASPTRTVWRTRKKTDLGGTPPAAPPPLPRGLRCCIPAGSPRCAPWQVWGPLRRRRPPQSSTPCPQLWRLGTCVSGRAMPSSPAIPTLQRHRALRKPPQHRLPCFALQWQRLHCSVASPLCLAAGGLCTLHMCHPTRCCTLPPWFQRRLLFAVMNTLILFGKAGQQVRAMGAGVLPPLRPWGAPWPPRCHGAVLRPRARRQAGHKTPRQQQRIHPLTQTRPCSGADARPPFDPPTRLPVCCAAVCGARRVCQPAPRHAGAGEASSLGVWLLWKASSMHGSPSVPHSCTVPAPRSTSSTPAPTCFRPVRSSCADVCRVCQRRILHLLRVTADNCTQGLEG